MKMILPASRRGGRGELNQHRPRRSAASVAEPKVTMAMTPWLCPVGVRGPPGSSIGNQLMMARATGEDDQERNHHADAPLVDRLVQSDGCTEAGNGQTEGGCPVAGPVLGDPELAHRTPE